MSKFRRYFSRIAKPLLLTLLGVCLFLAGTLLVLLSPWFQDQLRQGVVSMMNKQPGTDFTLDYLHISPPLNVEIKGLSWKQDGDTMMAAGSFTGSINPLPLLQGTVDVKRAFLLHGVYNMGNPDSATMIQIHADSALLAPASVRLNPMLISVKDGSLSGADIRIYINPNPPKTAKDASTEQSPLDIDVQRLRIRRLRYSMSLLPTIDSLGVTIEGATLQNAAISLLKQNVSVKSLHGYGLDASYIAPDSATIAHTIVAPPDTTPTAPWTVTVADVSFDRSAGLYTTHGVKPLPGLDFAYISATNMTLAVKDFYNQATTVRLPITLTGTERCGVNLAANGTLDIDSLGMTFKDFHVSTTNGTSLSADAYLGMGDMTTDPSLPVSLTAGGDITATDLNLMFPAFKPYLAPMKGNAGVDADIDVSGTMGDLKIKRLDMNIPSVMHLMADGTLQNVMNPDRLGGDISLKGSVGDVQPWVRLFAAGSDIVVPPMTVDGNILFSNGNYDGDIAVVTRGGDIKATGSLHGRGMDYSAALTANSFPVQVFMPALGLSDVSGTVSADGHGFDFTSPATSTSVDLDLRSMTYMGETYSNISGNIALRDGQANIDLRSTNTGLKFDLTGTANISPEKYAADISLNASDIDLQKLKASTTPATISLDMDLKGSVSASMKDIAATVFLKNFEYIHPEGDMQVDAVTAHLNTTDSVINASVRNRDMYIYFSSPCGIDSLMAHMGRVMPVLDNLMATHSISVSALQTALPMFNLDVEGGSDNALNQILADSQMGFKHISLRASNDSTLNATGNILGFSTSSIRLDTITMNVSQQADRLNYVFAVNNRPGTFDNWAHATLDGFFDTNRLGLKLHQQNIKGQTGFNIGADVTMEGDSTAVLRFNPLDPTIGYQPWTINKGNFIVYNFHHRHIDAELRMEGKNSHLNLYTENVHSTDSLDHGEDENLVVDIAGIKLQDWISINPFAPTIKGDLAAQMKLNGHDKTLTGNGYVSLTDFIYGKQKVGNFKADLDVSTSASGRMSADMALWVNGQKSITLTGLLNDTTAVSPFNLDLTMIRFPLNTVNAFLPGVASLNGTLNGRMDVSGDMDNPKLNGYLQFDSANVQVVMLGTDFKMSDERIPVDSNMVHINNFSITGCNENPLTVDGTVDLTSLMAPGIDLKLNAANMMVVNSSRASRGASVYGKAYLDLNATARGTLSFLDIDAKLGVLSGTNVTYVMAMDAQSVLESQSNDDMVKFVNFADSTAVTKADSIVEPEGTLMNLTAALDIEEGSTINVDLGAGTSDRVQIKSQGLLNFTMSPLNPGRLLGRLNINGGFVRYSPPLMSEKNFEFKEGSYVAFTGDMMNPTLNIHAVDRVRANVTAQGQNSRLIYFDVLLDVTGTLGTMDVKFDLATDDDATVANELASMSPTQRASSAMNLLITNIYTSGDTKADANLGGNALYSFLTSKFNSWAANTIKGVDLSLGINQYDNVRGGTSQQTTSYSYRVSKSLFNDRFKIVVGGNYSTDADADQNLAQNLVNDISFEYLLNQQGTMVIRIFRHTGYESILEGEITQTGVGFVYKRKISRLADMFKFARNLRDRVRRHRTDTSLPDTEESDTSSVDTQGVKPESDEPENVTSHDSI